MESVKPPYDESTAYSVKLRKEVTLYGARLLPLPVHEMSGKALNDLVEKESEDALDHVAVLG